MKKNRYFIYFFLPVLGIGIFLLYTYGKVFYTNTLLKSERIILKTDKTPEEIAQKSKEASSSSILIEKTDLKAGEGLTVYIKKDIYPENYALLLYSVDNNANVTGVDFSSCVNPSPTPPAENVFGCYITISPEAEGSYVFRVIAPLGEVLDESEEIIIKQ